MDTGTIIALYALLSVIIGFLGALFVWLYAISEGGIILGGTIGLIPAAVAGVVIAILWPIGALILAWMWISTKISYYA